MRKVGLKFSSLKTPSKLPICTPSVPISATFWKRYNFYSLSDITKPRYLSSLEDCFCLKITYSFKTKSKQSIFTSAFIQRTAGIMLAAKIGVMLITALREFLPRTTYHPPIIGEQEGVIHLRKKRLHLLWPNLTTAFINLFPGCLSL